MSERRQGHSALRWNGENCSIDVFDPHPGDTRRPPFETFKRPTCKGCFALGSACGSCERCDWERAQNGEYGVALQPPKPAPAASPLTPFGEALRELLAAAKLMRESLPVYSASSAAYTRKERFDQAIAVAERLGLNLEETVPPQQWRDHRFESPISPRYAAIFAAQPNLIFCRDWITASALELLTKESRVLSIQEICKLNSPFL